jgi:hypothetical protein
MNTINVENERNICGVCISKESIENVGMRVTQGNF